MVSSTNSDTKSQVISTYFDRPVFSCSQCSSVIVRADYFLKGLNLNPFQLRHCRMNLSVNHFLAEKDAASKYHDLSAVGFMLTGHLLSLTHSATNVKLGKREDRPLLYVRIARQSLSGH